MKRRFKRDEQGVISGRLLFICAVFLLGGMLGSLLVPCLADDSRYYLSAVSEEGEGFRSFFVFNSLLLAAIFAGGFYRKGRPLILIAIAAKGFMCAFSVTCFIRAYGARGYLPAFLSVFFSSLVILPVMALLACRALELCADIGKRGRGAYMARGNREYIISAIVSLALIAAAGVIHCYIMPVFTFMTAGFTA